VAVLVTVLDALFAVLVFMVGVVALALYVRTIFWR
jgi:hypothetical protein